VDVSGWTFDGLSFTFANGTIIPAHAYALVVPIDPATFGSSYNIPAATQIFGPFFGLLDDAGDDIRLKRPGVPAGAITPFIPEDRVNYSADAPWPLAAGVSLIRRNQLTYGNDPANWANSTGGGSPGKPNLPPVPSGVYDITTALPRIVVTFTEDVSSTLNENMLTLANLSGGAVPATTMQWDPTTLSATWTFSSIPADGNYKATLHAANLRDWAGNQLDGNGDSLPGGDYTQDFFYLGGDANHDRSVNFADLVAVAQNYGKTGGQNLAQGDFNADGNVDFADLVKVAQNYGKTLAPPAPAAPVASQPVVAAPGTQSAVTPAPISAAEVIATVISGASSVPNLASTVNSIALKSPVTQLNSQPISIAMPPLKKTQPPIKHPLPTLSPLPKPAAKPMTFSKARIR
jgi:hypothetical protein